MTNSKEGRSTEMSFSSWKPEHGLWFLIRADWIANKDSQKGRVVMVLFRIASWFRRTNKLTHMIGVPYLVFYRIAVEWILGIEIPPATRIGRGLAVHHGQGIVVNNRTIIGDYCCLRQGVTLGNRSSDDKYGCPTLGNHIIVGANGLVLGRIVIGDNAIIGAGAVVLKDVESGDTVVGNPAKPLLRK
jgi:putative colanic acid biosynthesis acetyltransferase WcaB